MIWATANESVAVAPSSSPPPPLSPSPTPPLPHLSTYNPATFTGRDDEIAHLTQTLTSGCRLLVIHGMTGIGKTALAEGLAANFLSPPHPLTPSPHPLPYIQVVLDRGISSPDFTRGAIAILQAMGDDTAQQLPDDQILPYLLKVLTEKPCWLQLDSLEFLLRQDDNGDYHFTDPTWINFFCQFLTLHPSPFTFLVLTSQALPVDLVEGCDRLSNLWHEYPLRGLEETHWLDLFRNYGVRTQTPTESSYLCQIARYFDGHPLILKMIAGDIGKPVFGGSVTKYWQNYYSQQTRPKLHQSQEQRARNWVNQTLQTLPPLALQMLQHCSVFRRPVPESFYLQILDSGSPLTLKPYRASQKHPLPFTLSPLPFTLSDLTSTLNTLKSRNLVEEKDIQNGEILLQLHNLIRDAAYKQLKADHPTWSATERKAADLWLTAYQPAPDAENLETVRSYLEAFDHYCEIEDWEAAQKTAWTRLDTPTQEYLCWQLGTWGYFREQVLFYSKQLDLAQKVNNAEEIACLLGNLGLVHTYLGNYKRAIDFHQQFLTISREIGDRKGEGTALCNLGLAYGCLGNYEQAIDFHQQALVISREIGDREGEGKALGNLGFVNDSLGNYEQAIDYHQQSLTILREIGVRQGEGIVLVNMGTTQLKLEQYPDSLTNNQTALKIFREIGDRTNEAEALKNLAELHQQLGEGEVALEYCQQALALATELGIPLQKECEELLVEIEKRAKGKGGDANCLDKTC